MGPLLLHFCCYVDLAFEWLYFNSRIHSTVDGHVGFFWLGSITHRAISALRYLSFGARMQTFLLDGHQAAVQCSALAFQKAIYIPIAVDEFIVPTLPRLK